MGGAPQPPPQTARAILRSLFARKAGKPEVSATLYDDPDLAHSTLEFVNEGADALGLVCRCRTERGFEDLDLGGLGPGSSTSVEIGRVHGAFECVWSCADRRRRRYAWTYEGGRRRLRRGDHRTLEALFAYAYPARGE